MSKVYQQGDVIRNKNGSCFEVIALVTPDKTLLRRVMDDYILEAVNINSYDNGEIEWDYSHSVGFPKSLENAIKEQVIKLCPTFDCININRIKSLVLVHLDGEFFGVYDISLGKFVC